MRQRNSGVAPLIAIFLIIVIIVATIYIVQRFSPKPPIEVSYSLEPSTIKADERSRLSLAFNNIDLKSHEISVLFEASYHIQIYEGNEHLLEQNSYTFTLEASDPSEQRVFTVSGSLEAGTLSSKYPIAFRVVVDGEELGKAWDNPILTVEKP